jgi:acetyl esterase/lipase
MRLTPVLLCLLMAASVPASAQGPLRERLKARYVERLQDGETPEEGAHAYTAVLPGTTRQTVSYGSDPLQAMDVYSPVNARNAPMIVMVHGGGWRTGDKANSGVVENKVKHWLPQGYIVVSVNYRLLPQADAYAQAEDVAAALAYVQKNAANWGGDVSRLILMGHSAGAQLVALTSADPSVVTAKGGRLWAGTVVLDSATLDLRATMTQQRVLPLYTNAFGTDPKRWAQASPLERLTPQAIPMMMVCSTQRKDRPCDQADTFSRALRQRGKPAPVQKEDKSHGEINKMVGVPGPYTDAIDAFIAARLGQALGGHK